MRIGFQDTLAQPGDWRWFDSREWTAQPCAPIPDGHEPRDVPGWGHGLNVQGVVFVGDFYAVEHIDSETIRVVVWNDDPKYFLVDEGFVDVWTFKNLAPDPKLGGAINTRQTRQKYMHKGGAAWLNHVRLGLMPGVNLKDLSDLPRFDLKKIPGLMVSDELHELHKAARSHPSWRSWTEGLDPSDVVDGLVPSQRDLGRYNIPDGTQTYYHNATDLATGVHNADHENELGTTAAGSSNEAASIRKASEELAFCATTASGQPGSAAWPIGAYRYQLDAVATVGADITYGLLTIGGVAGHFARVNTGLTSPDLETKTQDVGAYVGTGINLATTGTVSWTAGVLSDRFECLVAAGNANAKDAQLLTLQLGEADDYADGPWEEAAGPQTGHFMGFNF